MNLSLEQAQKIIYNSYIYKTFYSDKIINHCQPQFSRSLIWVYVCSGEGFTCQIDILGRDGTIVIRFDNNRTREIYSSAVAGSEEYNTKSEYTVDYASENATIYFSIWRWNADECLAMKVGRQKFFSRYRQSSVLNNLVSRKLS